VNRDPKEEISVEFVSVARRLPSFRAMHRTWHILALVAGLSSVSAWAQVSPCDLNADGAVNIADVQLAVNMSVGMANCTANIMGAGICNVVVVQRVVNAALGQACVTGSGHSASLTWVASPSTGVTGYNIYRGTVSGGPYTQLNSTPIGAVTYQDSSVLGGQTYYYVVKAVGSGNTLSIASNEIQAVVPSP
jgi:hypothetical protein